MIEKRYLEISLTVDGTTEQADTVRNAIGLAISDKFLGDTVTPLIHSENIARVNWEVRGYRWVQAEPDNRVGNSA
jgi:hypothetical protein